MVGAAFEYMLDPNGASKPSTSNMDLGNEVDGITTIEWLSYEIWVKILGRGPALAANRM